MCLGLVGCASSDRGVYAPAKVGDAEVVGRPGMAVMDGKAVAAPAIPMGNPRTVARVIVEGKNGSQVMAHLTWLTENGPRLTGSARTDAANRWALERFESWGLSGELYQWGTVQVRFDRGPSTARILNKTEKKNEAGEVEVTWKPGREMQFTTLAWSAGTDGPVAGPVVREPANEEEYTKLRDEGKLKGAWILLKPMSVTGRQGVRGPGAQAGSRWTSRKEARDKVASGGSVAELPIDDRLIFDGIAGFISTPKDERDRVWTTAIPKWRDKSMGDMIPDVEIIVRLADYDYINSRLTDGDEFKVEIDAKNVLTAGPFPVYNTIAEIRGTEKPDEVVIVSAHLDSWDGPGSRGATDNGTGSAVTLEAARLLAAAGARPKRTIRFILWTGEEQGLLGSHEYVAALGDNLANISAVFVDDGGTNYEGGVQCVADQAAMLAAATAPVNFVFVDSESGKSLVCNVRTVERFPRGGGSDHASFTAKGVPGFFWDEVGRADYGFGWHTQHDTIALAVPEYLQQSATNAAVTAYNLANAPTLLPRWVDPPADEKKEGEETPRRGRRGE